MGQAFVYGSIGTLTVTGAVVGVKINSEKPSHEQVPTPLAAVAGGFFGFGSVWVGLFVIVMGYYTLNPIYELGRDIIYALKQLRK